MTASKVVVVLFLVCVSSLSAASGSMALRITDARTHHPIPNALIKGYASESLTTEAFKVTTDPAGRAKVVGLPTGEYGLEITAPGFRTMRTDALVEAGKATKAGGQLDTTTEPEEESDAVLKSQYRPGYVLLHEYVSDAETGEPIPGVKVRSLKGKAETTTDANGYFKLSTPVPPGMYNTETFIYEKPGYKTLILRNLIVVANEDMGGVAIDMERGSGVRDIDATHKLMQKPPPGPNIQPQIEDPPPSKRSAKFDQWLNGPGKPQ